jgi:MICOS complex subunit MIC12
VTLTLSLAYFTVLAHQRNREHQSRILRAQTTLISGLTDPLPPAYRPTRAELAAAERANLIESAKDRWNAEVQGAAHWVQEQDWDEVREGVETAVGRLIAKASGKAYPSIEKVEQRASAVATDAKAEIQKRTQEARSITGEKAGEVTATARSAYADAKAVVKKRAEEVKDAYADVKARTSEAVGKAEEKTEETRGSLFATIGWGLEKGKQAVGLASTKSQEAGEKLEAKTDQSSSPVDHALRQRYEKPDGLTKSAQQVLAERYLPADQKDKTDLKGV